MTRPALLLALLLSSPVPARAENGGKTLSVCDDVQDPATLDPQKEFSEKNHTIVQQIYEGLVRFGPNGEIEPALAVSWRRVDPLRIRFKLREGVRFHDGETFDAEAVRFSIERYLKPETGFPALGFIASLDKVEIVDALTVDVVTKHPDGLLLNRLAGFILVVPPGFVRKNGEDALSSRPVGTGAFRFVSWDKGRRIVLSANKDYWEPGLPKIGTLIFRFLPIAEQVGRLLRGDLDLVTELPGTKTFEVQSSTAARVVKGVSLYTVTAALNVSSGPLSDVRVRQALNFGLNTRELVRYDLIGNGETISSLIFPSYPAAYQDASIISYEYDLPRAKALLKSAGRKGFKLRMLEVKATRAARIITDQWKRLGVEVELVSTTDAAMREDLQKKGPWDIFLSGCPDPMYHPYFIHSIFLYSKSPYSLSKVPEVDALIEQIVQEVDEGAQIERTKALAKYVNEKALTLFTYQRVKTYGLRKGVVFQPYASGMPYFRAIEAL